MPVNVASKTDPRVAIDSPAPSAMIQVVETLFPVFVELVEDLGG